jgi:hypothetical protein
MALAAPLSYGGLLNAENEEAILTCPVHFRLASFPSAPTRLWEEGLGDSCASWIVMDFSPFVLFLTVFKVKFKVIILSVGYYSFLLFGSVKKCFTESFKNHTIWNIDNVRSLANY